jgi:hypothetical protein
MHSSHHHHAAEEILVSDADVFQNHLTSFTNLLNNSNADDENGIQKSILSPTDAKTKASDIVSL